MFLVILTILNCVSVKWVDRVQNIFTAGKIIALLIIIGMGFYCLIMGKFLILKLLKNICGLKFNLKAVIKISKVFQ